MRGIAFGASLSNLVSIDRGVRRQLHERVHSLQGFSRGDSEQGAPYKGSGDSSPADRLSQRFSSSQDVLIQNLPGVTCTSRAHDLCFRIQSTQGHCCALEGSTCSVKGKEEVVLGNSADIALKLGR